LKSNLAGQDHNRPIFLKSRSVKSIKKSKSICEYRPTNVDPQMSIEARSYAHLFFRLWAVAQRDLARPEKNKGRLKSVRTWEIRVLQIALLLLAVAGSVPYTCLYLLLLTIKACFNAPTVT
jgi:hypothetical protein